MVTQVLIETDDATTVVDAPVVQQACVETLPARQVETLAAIFSALGEPARLRIVHALSQQELCVGDLAAVVGLAVPAVSQHLRLLRTLRIVRNRRAGKLVYYALDDAHVSALFAMALAHVRGGEE